MKRIKMMGLCLVAAFALSAVGSSVASAEEAPEFTTKTAVGTVAGSVEVKGYQELPGKLKGQTSGISVECLTGNSTGWVTGPKTLANNVTIFHGCQVSGYPCQNGTESGVITTNKLAGTLGFVAKEMPGVRYEPETGTENASFECGGGAVLIKSVGRLFGSLSGASGTTVALNKLASKSTLLFAESKNRQKYKQWYLGSVELPNELKTILNKYPTYTTEEEGTTEISKFVLTTNPLGQLGITK